MVSATRRSRGVEASPHERCTSVATWRGVAARHGVAFRHGVPASVIATLLALCAGCGTPGSAPREFYAVLPEAGGKSGALLVQRDGREHLLEGPYAALSSDTAAPFKAAPAEVDQGFAPALQAQPPRPRTTTLYFMDGRDEMTAESQRALRPLLDEILSRPAPEVVVIGHADTRGSHAENDALALRRAERVRRELQRLGLREGAITVIGRGKREPLVATPDNTSEPRNRRVLVEVR